jgi:hypothetical protein
MIPTTEPAPVTSPEPAKPHRDRRGFWRILLAVIAPMPFLAKGVYYLLSPVAGDATFKESVTAFASHRDLMEALKWFDAVFVVALVPATIAAAWVARRGAPRLTTVGAVIALSGFLVGLPLLGGVETPALVTVQHDLDVTTMAALDDALHHEPLLGIASLLFIVGIVFGLGLLGGALKKSRAVPAWAGIAVMVGGATHPFIPTSIGQGHRPVRGRGRVRRGQRRPRADVQRRVRPTGRAHRRDHGGRTGLGTPPNLGRGRAGET